MVDVSEMISDDALLVASFILGDATFGIDTAFVQEVVLAGELTLVHHAPVYVAGIRNLRGRIVTVIDLGLRLGLGAVEPGPETRILIVDWKGEPVGLLVDAIADTVVVDPSLLETPPSNLTPANSRGVQGVFRTAGRLVALLEPHTVLEPEDNAPNRGEREGS